MMSISEKTPIQIGLLIAVVGIFLGGLWASAWWGGVTQTKLETVQKSLDTITAKFPVFDAGLVTLGARVQVLESVGSPALKVRIEILERELLEVRKNLDHHILIDEPPKRP